MTFSRREIVLGTRGSALALAQANQVRDALERGHPGIRVRVERIVTTGDARPDVPLAQLDRGMFVGEIEAAVRSGSVDAGVHSAKDMPSTVADGLAIAAFLPRADARDVVVSRDGIALCSLPAGARVGTSSPRRVSQLRALRPDLVPVEIRGNVDTRLRKLAAGDVDALMLAAAGLIRLGRADAITEWLDAADVIPCVGQGAIAVECRADDGDLVALVASLDDAMTRATVVAERAFLAELGAGCRAAVAAHATVADGSLTMHAMIGATDGRHVRGVASAPASASAIESLGRDLARSLMLKGGADFLAPADTSLASLRVAVTRPEAQALELAALLRARGASPVLSPTIEIRPAEETDALDAALRGGSYQWLVFTSANAVRAVADRLEALGIGLPAATRLAAVGTSTAAALAQRVRMPDFTSARATARNLAEELPVRAGARVLFPRGDLASGELVDGLRRRGADVSDIAVYRTTSSPHAAELARLIRSQLVDAVVFTSPSAVRNAIGASEAILSAHRPPVVACIGETTAAAARDAGITTQLVADSQSVGGIVESLEHWFRAHPVRRAS